MPISLSDRILDLAAVPNASFSPCEADQWVSDAFEQLAKDGFVLAEMQKTISIDEYEQSDLPSPPNKWKAVSLKKAPNQKRKIIIKGRK